MLLSGVSKRYGWRGPLTLKEVDLALPEAGMVTVGGANGSGKSTLLRLVAGATRPTSGRIVGRPGTVAYAPEHFELAARLTACDYLVHVSRLRRLDRRAVERAAEIIGLTPHLGTPVPDLSKGNRQRLVLAQALMPEVKLLVLDEPFNGLDVAGGHLLQEELRHRVEAGATVVLTDHEQRFDQTGDLVVMVAQGHAAEVAQPAHVSRRLSSLRVRGRIDATSLPAGVQPVWAEDDGRSTTLVLEDRHVDALLLHLLSRGGYLEEVRRCSP